jgi:hypothetical protein
MKKAGNAAAPKVNLYHLGFLITPHDFFCVSQTSVPSGIDASSTFFTPMIPAEIKVAVPLLHKIPEADLNAVLGAASDSARRGDVSESGFGAAMEDLDAMSPENCLVYTALRLIVKTAIRTRTKASSVEKDLVALNIPVHVVSSIVELLKKQRLELELQSLTHRTRLPRLDGLQWRVDVAISSSSLLRVFRPSIMMQMVLSDGRMKTFDVSVEQFHQLRYNVAKVLREMQELERHPSESAGKIYADIHLMSFFFYPLCWFEVMRIADEQAKKTFEE